MSKLIAQEVSLQLIRALREPLLAIARHDAGLAAQVRDAAASVHLNLAEGNRRVGKDRRHFFRISAGSCGEVKAGMEIADAWGYVDGKALAEVFPIIDRELGLLWGLTKTH